LDELFDYERYSVAGVFVNRMQIGNALASTTGNASTDYYSFSRTGRILSGSIHLSHANALGEHEIAEVYLRIPLKSDASLFKAKAGPDGQVEVKNTVKTMFSNEGVWYPMSSDPQIRVDTKRGGQDCHTTDGCCIPWIICGILALILLLLVILCLRKKRA
jgi:hypothetical protein